MLRTFLTSYFWPNCHRKNPGNLARAVVIIRAVARLAHVTMGRAAKMGGRYDQTEQCRRNSAVRRIGIVAALSQNGRSTGWTGHPVLASSWRRLVSFNGIVVAETRRLVHAECQHVATKTALDGVTRFSGIMGRGRTALDGTFLRRHFGREVWRIDHGRCRGPVSDVNSVKKRHFLRRHFGN